MFGKEFVLCTMNSNHFENVIVITLMTEACKSDWKTYRNNNRLTV